MAEARKEISIKIYFCLPERLLIQLDNTAQAQGYDNRSEYLRRLIREDLKQNAEG